MSLPSPMALNMILMLTHKLVAAARSSARSSRLVYPTAHVIFILGCSKGISSSTGPKQTLYFIAHSSFYPVFHSFTNGTNYLSSCPEQKPSFSFDLSFSHTPHPIQQKLNRSSIVKIESFSNPKSNPSHHLHHY